MTRNKCFYDYESLITKNEKLKNIYKKLDKKIDKKILFLKIFYGIKDMKFYTILKYCKKLL